MPKSSIAIRTPSSRSERRVRAATSTLRISVVSVSSRVRALASSSLAERASRTCETSCSSSSCRPETLTEI